MEAQVLSQWLNHAMPSFSVNGRNERSEQMPGVEGTQGPSPFKGAMSKIAELVTAPVQAAGNVINRFSSGGEGEIHESMMALEKSDIGFKFLVSAKNKAIEAYKETMRMG